VHLYVCSRLYICVLVCVCERGLFEWCVCVYVLLLYVCARLCMCIVWVCLCMKLMMCRDDGSYCGVGVAPRAELVRNIVTPIHLSHAHTHTHAPSMYVLIYDTPSHHTRTYTYTHARTHARTHAHVARIHTHTHTYTRTHTLYTHTHKRTQAYVRIICLHTCVGWYCDITK